GLITVQLLKANGCEVLGIDINEQRLKLAEKYGAKTVNPQQGGDPIAAAAGWTANKGVDGVIITASAETDEIVHVSAEICRERGRIVLVGVVGLNLQRADFYKKELTFQVSCSYGPGRYDEAYEHKGQDYPYGFVRWTEKRNFQAVLEMMRTGKLVVDDLISHRFDFAQASEAYDLLSQKREGLGIILQYPKKIDDTTLIHIPSAKDKADKKGAVIGVIGAGNFSKMTLMPALHKTGARIKYIADLKGEAALHLAKRYKAENAVSDYKLILQDPDINTVMIATRHNLHVTLVCEFLKAGKHVFVEKPLALNTKELQHIIDTAGKHAENMLMVGFNRRYSPHVQKIKKVLKNKTEPLALSMTINAGKIPPDHWVHDPAQGGGRIIGEACHFLDLMVFLTGSSIQSVSAHMMSKGTPVPDDKMSISLGFKDGSVGTVNYFANGSKAYFKEVLQVFSQGRIFKLDNFRQTTGYGCKGFRKFKTKRQDKGHAAECAAFVNRIQEGGESLISLAELVNVTLASFAAVTSAREERMVIIDQEYSSLLNK
ncbi:MAG: bi-domain-containing oxidoreductase, partial [bacterium]